MTQNFTALGAITPSETTRLGRLLAAGHLVATMTSKKTGQHITLTLDCCLKNEKGFPKWKHVRFEEATHVFINAGRRDRVATYYPKSGKFFPARNADVARVWAAEKTLIAADQRAGVEVKIEGEGTMAFTETFETTAYTVVSANICGKCKADLTDPVSIARGFGPTCWGSQTGSQHQMKAQQKLPVAVTAVIDHVTSDTGGVPPSHYSHAPATPKADEIIDSKGREVPRSFEELAARLGQ